MLLIEEKVAGVLYLSQFGREVSQTYFSDDLNN